MLYYLTKLFISAIISLLIVIGTLLLKILSNGLSIHDSLNQSLYSSLLIIFFISLLIVFFLLESIVLNLLNYKYPCKKSKNNIRLKKLPKKMEGFLSMIFKHQFENELENRVFEERENYRKEFIGNISHELKTPLFTIQGYVLTLLDGTHKKKKLTEKYLERTAKGVDRIISIVNELDTIAKFESDTLTLELYPFDIDQMTMKVFELFEMEAHKKCIGLLMEKDGLDRICVWADQEKIQQVMVNLISNSIKYGKKGGLTKVAFEQESENILIQVIDDGPGVDQVHLPRLFERFYRVDQTRSRNKGGSGLGLAIVKHIIEAHNQQIELKSRPQQGTKFSFSLPIYNPKVHIIEQE